MHIQEVKKSTTNFKHIFKKEKKKNEREMKEKKE